MLMLTSILTKIFQEQLDFTAALEMAQQLGFAESNPKLDIGGFDAANKLSILLAHSFGVIAGTNQFIFNGIENICLLDADYAKEKKFKSLLISLTLLAINCIKIKNKSTIIENIIIYNTNN